MGQVNCCHGSRDYPEPEQQSLPEGASPEPLQRQRVRVTQGRRTRKRDLLLFRDTLVIAKAKRGSALRPQLCLALATLQVLSSGKGAAGDDTKEEEGEDTKSLALIWPCGSCVITFCSRVVKELWVSTLLGPPEGVEGARVTQLPSIKLLLKELRHRKAATMVQASSLERLVKGQAEQPMWPWACDWVASKLPKANLLLLKNLLALLHNISRNVVTSRMTAHNLAICVGPNLLSPPEEHTLPLDILVRETQKVTQLVEFLIEHEGELFEEEVPGLAGASGDESPALQLEAETAERPGMMKETS
ncbi:t-cell activation rho gtpase-activating protein [Limosa lapponica baueri]|uniref:T-cell activation rho gtpase-activating protein n=1 Tax=Limosa lapponica baueri TaxID=1758121 RepID=A0A2I0UJ41_LIMLA|nr:t-cell activation rho gtpase-activating protein [Limosa lapponica baueri]